MSWELEFVELGGRMTDHQCRHLRRVLHYEGFVMLCPAGLSTYTVQSAVFLRFIDLETETPRLNS